MGNISSNCILIGLAPKAIASKLISQVSAEMVQYEAVQLQLNPNAELGKGTSMYYQRPSKKHPNFVEVFFYYEGFTPTNQYALHLGLTFGAYCVEFTRNYSLELAAELMAMPESDDYLIQASSY